MSMLETALANNLIPDTLVRLGIRGLLRQRLREELRGDLESRQQRFTNLIRNLESGPVAVNTQDANDQHYEVPAAFYQQVLGKHLKYSCGYWPEGVTHLDQAEKVMLDLTMERAQLEPGQRILELGCGWGSLTLAMAAAYPTSHITAVSNSASQRAFIEAQARLRGLHNVSIITCDMNQFHIQTCFDRVVSVEMFEHMRNYRTLFNRIHRFLKDDGKLFVHIFTHRELTYLFEVRDATDWMAKYFFSGGIMPSDHLLLYFSQQFRIDGHWRMNGRHYQKTAEAWLANMDRNRETVLALFKETYGPEHTTQWWAWWRTFFMSCAELWGYGQGEEWFVSHYLFSKLDLKPT